jgi:adenylyltransferase/sulfurtransferase
MVGTIDIFDHDIVSVSNLHRQVLHSIERVGMNKAVSAALAIKS